MLARWYDVLVYVCVRQRKRKQCKWMEGSPGDYINEEKTFWWKNKIQLLWTSCMRSSCSSGSCSTYICLTFSERPVIQCKWTANARMSWHLKKVKSAKSKKIEFNSKSEINWRYLTEKGKKWKMFSFESKYAKIWFLSAVWEGLALSPHLLFQFQPHCPQQCSFHLLQAAVRPAPNNKQTMSAPSWWCGGSFGR